VALGKFVLKNRFLCFASVHKTITHLFMFREAVGPSFECQDRSNCAWIFQGSQEEMLPSTAALALIAAAIQGSTLRLRPQSASTPARRQQSPRSVNAVSIIDHHATAEECSAHHEVTRSADVMFEEMISRCEAMLEKDVLTEDAIAFAEDVPTLLRAVFDADFQRYLNQSRPYANVDNLTCISPVTEATAWRGGPDDLTRVAMRTGRTCPDGACSGTCSRMLAADMATDAECEELCSRVSALLLHAAPGSNFRVADFAAADDVRATLLFSRLLERLRRATAHEYGLPLASVAPHSPFVSQWVFRGHSGTHTPLHCDEAICGDYHYSSVLHLTTQGDTFEGGDFVFSDTVPDDAHTRTSLASPPDANMQLGKDVNKELEGRPATPDTGSDRRLTRVSPQRGRALLFSSGWENIHFVDVIDSGVRHALVTFFMTRAAWATSGVEDMRGPVEAQEVAGALLRYVLCPESEEDEGQFTVLWHSIFAAPLVDACDDQSNPVHE
jgi:hypothetical protein